MASINNFYLFMKSMQNGTSYVNIHMHMNMNMNVNMNMNMNMNMTMIINMQPKK